MFAAMRTIRPLRTERSRPEPGGASAALGERLSATLNFLNFGGGIAR